MYTTKTADLVETFNYLIGLRVQENRARKSYAVSFESVAEEAITQVDGANQRWKVQSCEESTNGSYHFKSLTGWVPKNPYSPNDGEKLQVLIIWRNQTGDERKDALVLNTWLEKEKIDVTNYDRIYVNGSTIIQSDKVQSLEDAFFSKMWE